MPFQGKSPTDVMMQHSSMTPIIPSSVNTHVPPALDQVIMRGLAKDPTQRFSSAATMTVAVAHALGVPAPTILGQQQDTSEEQDPPTRVTLSSTPASSGQPPTGSTPWWQGPASGSQYVPGWPSIRTGQTGGIAPVTPGLTPSPQSMPKEAHLITTPAQQIHSPKPQRRRSGRIATLIAIVVIVCIIGGLAIVFIPGLFLSNSIIGQAFYTSSGQITPGTAQGIADQMQIDLHNVPSPQAGKSYYVWLLADKVKVGSDQDLTGPPPIHPPLLLTNNLPVNNGNIHFFYPGDAHHNNLLSETSRLLITEENTSQKPSAPSSDRSTWRYFAMIPQQPIPGDPTQLNAINHIRHLFYNGSHIKELALPGGLDFWASRNTEKVLEWSVAARDDWYGADTTTAQIQLMQPLFIRILDYLDGEQNVHIDVPPGTPLLTDPTQASVALLTVDPLRQGGANLTTNPQGYIDHIELHVNQIARAPDVSSDMRLEASQILIASQNAGKWLSNARKDAVALFAMSNNDPIQLQQSQAGQLLDDMVNQATCAYIGQLDPVTNQIHPGLIQAHYEIQKLAVLNITTNLPNSL